MQKVWAILVRFLHPPKWIRSPAPFLLLPALWHALREMQPGNVLSCLIYSLSAYTLVVWLLPLPGLVRNIRKFVLQQLTRSHFGQQYIQDPVFRGSVSLYHGMIANFCYAAFRFTVGIRYASIWFLSIAIYYLILGGMRAYLAVCYHHRTPNCAPCCYRQTAQLLFLLNLPMGGMILLMVHTNSGYSYPEYILYCSALYTFYTATISVVHLIRFRKYGSPILSAAKILNFIAAMMSLLGLQTAMIAQFSADNTAFRKIMNAITGGIIWCTVVVMPCLCCTAAKK